MSLAVLADHMASKGRGNDSMLVHMTPREVAGLQALAKAHGGSLTINPDTGLPEAGWVDKLLPTIIGAGISFFSGGTIDPKTAAMIVGGVQTVRTGDIGKGIQAGLGAYGGAGITAGMTAAGESAIGSQAAGQSYLSSSVPSVLEGASPGLAADMAYNLGQAGIDTAGAEATKLAQQAAAERIAAASPFDKLSAGAKAFGDNPMSFANKDNLKYLAAAAGPAIMAGANVQAKGPQTVTKPGMIRPYSYDPYSGGFTAASPYEAAPTRAAEGGLMGMAAGGYSPGMFDFAQKSEPVVRMASGGVPGYAGNDGSLVGGYKPSDTEIFNYFKTPGLTDAKIAQDMQTFGVSAADIARITGTQGQQTDYERRFAQAVATPTTSAPEFLAATQNVGLQNQALANAMQNAGMSQAAQYAATHGLSDINGAVDTQGKPVGFYNQIGYTAGALPGDQGGLEGLYANINYAAQGLQKQISAGNMTGQQAREAALTEMNRIGMSAADLKAATGKTLAELFPDTTVKPPPPSLPPPVIVTPGETKLDSATTYDNGAFGNYGSGNVTGTDYLGRTVSIATPGDIITNPDNTRTAVPNIPGRPVGGFTGMDAVKSAYTAGGGSLGYIPYAPKTIEEFDAKYNKLTGGSKQAYDYLMGKTPYSAKPFTPTGEVQKPYSEAVLGMPVNTSKRMYIFDPATKTYKINPDYAIPTYDKDGKKTYNLTNKDVLTYMATKPSNTDFYNWAKTNNLSAEQIAAATGMPITEVQKMLTGGTPKDAAAVSNAFLDQNAGGGGDAGGPGPGGSGPGGIGGAGGPASTSAAGEGDFARGGLSAINMARGGQYDLGDYSDGGRLLRGPGDGVSDSIPASIGNKRPARLADGEFVVPARIVSELGNGSTEAGARKLYGMMDRIQAARRGTVGKGRVAKNSRADKHLPA
jgi:hypothetical protein